MLASVCLSYSMPSKRCVVYSAPDKPVSFADTTASIRYKKLVEHDRGFAETQFDSPLPTRVPWKAIVLAATLFIFGSFLILVGVMLLAGFIDNKYSDRTWPLLILGTLMFIPGAYHVRIAYYAYTGHNGYSFDDIPDFD